MSAKMAANGIQTHACTNQRHILASASFLTDISASFLTTVIVEGISSKELFVD